MRRALLQARPLNKQPCLVPALNPDVRSHVNRAHAWWHRANLSVFYQNGRELFVKLHAVCQLLRPPTRCCLSHISNFYAVGNTGMGTQPTNLPPASLAAVMCIDMETATDCGSSLADRSRNRPLSIRIDSCSIPCRSRMRIDAWAIPARRPTRCVDASSIPQRSLVAPDRTRADP